MPCDSRQHYQKFSYVTLPVHSLLPLLGFLLIQNAHGAQQTNHLSAVPLVAFMAKLLKVHERWR